MSDYRFHVSGKDENGDRWTFSTNDRELADQTLDQMREDLSDAQLAEA